MPHSAAPPPAATPGERIAKLLARAGVASRREVERMIAEGRVARDGVALDTPATVLASLAGVTVDGNPIAQAEPSRLFLFHKPTGLLVTERDPRGRPTIYDRLPKDLPRLVPVGRLDLNTEGLLLLTTDGGLKRQLELPATGVERTYRARVYGPVSQASLEALIDGIEIDGVRYGSIDANHERRTGANSWIELTLTEGKNREVRRVLEHLGLQVGRLIRTRYGPFILADLPANGIGEVGERDLVEFQRTLGKRGKPDRLIAVVPLSTTAPRQKIRPTPRTQPHPGESRSPSPATSQRGTSHGSRLGMDPGLRRGGDKPKAHAQPNRAAGDTTTPRPARPVRKAGWAKAKPKSGPTRPRKPRA